MPRLALLQLKAIVSLSNIHCLAVIFEVCSVFFEVRTELLYDKLILKVACHIILLNTLIFAFKAARIIVKYYDYGF
jgi:hypothetical protein